MSSLVVRLRLLSLYLAVLFVPAVNSRKDVLFTSSVTYCEPPETILIQQLDVTYIANNNSVSFNVSAASVEPNVTATANLFLNVYGMHPLNFTIDLCSILSGALCPLPMYNFTGSENLPLPASLGLDKKIPKAAFHVPDLEAFAQLTLTDLNSGEVKACIQVTLSNGWSLHQRGVELTTFSFAVIALLSAMWWSFSPNFLIQHRFLELMQLFQSIAITGLLDLNYPSVYRAFTLNFAWAMGLVEIQFIQKAINKMVHVAGGDLTSASSIGFVNRKLSPYNVGALLNASQSVAQREVVTVTPSSSNVLQAGVPIFLGSIGISTSNGFMTVFFAVLFLAAILATGLTLEYMWLRLPVLRNRHTPDFLIERTNAYPGLLRTWVLRLCLAVYTPVLVFAFYQWTLIDSAIPVTLSVILTIVIPGYVCFISSHIIRLARRSSPDLCAQYAGNGPIYAQYTNSRYYFYAILIWNSFLKAILVAFAKKSGIVQISLLILFEFCIFLAYSLLRPSPHRRRNVLNTYVAFTKLVAAALMVVFLESIAVKPIPRVATGIAIAALFSVAVIVALVDFVISLTWRTSSIERTQPTVLGPMTEGRKLEVQEDEGVHRTMENQSDALRSVTITGAIDQNPATGFTNT